MLLDTRCCLRFELEADSTLPKMQFAARRTRQECREQFVTSPSQASLLLHCRASSLVIEAAGKMYPGAVAGMASLAAAGTMVPQGYACNATAQSTSRVASVVATANISIVS